MSIRVLFLAAVLAAVLVSVGAAAPAPIPRAAAPSDECMRRPFQATSLLLWKRPASRLGPAAASRPLCGGAYPIVLSIIGGYWTCDWGPGSSPRYTTRPGGC
jgi:hypothetical protein